MSGRHTRCAAGADRLQRIIGDRERIAFLQSAALESERKPAHALFGRAVGKRMRHHTTLRPLLYGVVPDLIGRTNRLLDVPAIEVAPVVVSPDASQKIGLQLEAHRVLVVVRFSAAGRNFCGTITRR